MLTETLRLALLSLRLLLLAAAATSAGAPTLLAQDSVVRAVLFFSPACPHCAQVIQRDLPVIFASFGGSPTLLLNDGVPERERVLFLLTNGRLEILLVNASLPAGNRLYRASLERAPGDPGVPRLVAGDSVLVGSADIPAHFTGLVRDRLARGGLDWPAVPGLREALQGLQRPPPVAALAPEATDSARVAAGAEPRPPNIAESAAAPPARSDSAALSRPDLAPEARAAWRSPRPRSRANPAERAVEPGTAPAAPSDTATGTAALADIVRDHELSPWDKFLRDPAANALALLVLAAMVAAVTASPALGRARATPRAPGRAVPAVALAGIAVAAYLAYVETTGATAVCGPVGDCNTVQQSPYAKLFGVLPVGVAGVAGYVAIVGTWLLARSRRGHSADWARLALLAMTLGGTLFSMYLTFLEPFVIGATCAWCLGSSVAITALFLLSVPSAADAWKRMHPSG